MASNATSTPTTPAMPTTTTNEAPSLWGMLARPTCKVRPTLRRNWPIMRTIADIRVPSAPRQGIHDTQAHAAQRRQEPDHQSDANHQRQTTQPDRCTDGRHWNRAAQRSFDATDDDPRQHQSNGAADENQYHR